MDQRLVGANVIGDIIRPAFNRGGYHSVTLRMRDPSLISALNSELEHNPRMQVQAVQERKYYEDQSGVVSGQLLGLALFVAIVMGIGAVFGAMNTMYALVAARTREIGTLRALGFSKVSILTAFGSWPSAAARRVACSPCRPMA